MSKRRNKSKNVKKSRIQAVTTAASLQIENPNEELASQSPVQPVTLRLAAAKKQRLTEDFAHAVAVILRTPTLRDMPIRDLEWLLLPPLLAGQSRVAFSRSEAVSGPVLPSALVLWACVSDALDKTLEAKAVKLSPDDWTSGNNIWLIVTAGDKHGVSALVEKLQEREFVGKKVKIRTQQTDGTFAVQPLPLFKPAADNQKQER